MEGCVWGGEGGEVEDCWIVCLLELCIQSFGMWLVT